MLKNFNLFVGNSQAVGTLSFNGKFIFELNANVDINQWDKFGIIPVDKETRKMESEDLFLYINSRLPINLRNASKEDKIKYIVENGLRVASDEFYFQAV
jgi:hypothetical protein